MYSASNPLPDRILAMSILRVLLYLFQLFVSIALFGALIPVVAVSRLMELAILAVHPLSLFLLRQASNLIICTTLQTANWIWSISQVTMVKTSPSNLGPTTIDAIGITDAEEEGEELRQHRPEVLQPETEAEPVASAPGTSQKLKE